MENEIQNKSGIIQRIVNAFNEKRKIIISIFIIIIFSLFGFKFFDYYKEMQSIKVSEKYIQAGLYLASGKTIESKNLYKDIILSENNFYSVLALNTIIEKDLEKDKNIIIEYFDKLENLNLSKSQKDLVEFKKALFLIENLNFEEGKKLIEKIAESESNFKDLAKEILSK